MQNPTWSSEMTEYLRQIYGGDYSNTIIADMVNRKFGTNVTRCSVIGKATRLGLKRGYTLYRKQSNGAIEKTIKPKLPKLQPRYWTQMPEVYSRFIELYKSGEEYQTIADKLNTEFKIPNIKITVSKIANHVKNAVLSREIEKKPGKLIKAPTLKDEHTAAFKTVTSLRMIARSKNPKIAATAKARLTIAEQELEELIKAQMSEYDPIHNARAIRELEGCKYPIGETGTPEFHFCNKPKINQTYCEEHHNLCVLGEVTYV